MNKAVKYRTVIGGNITVYNFDAETRRNIFPHQPNTLLWVLVFRRIHA